MKVKYRRARLQNRGAAAVITKSELSPLSDNADKYQQGCKQNGTDRQSHQLDEQLVFGLLVLLTGQSHRAACGERGHARKVSADHDTGYQRRHADARCARDVGDHEG